MTTVVLMIVWTGSMVWLGAWLWLNERRHKRLAKQQAVELTPERVTILLSLYYYGMSHLPRNEHLIEHGLLTDDGKTLTPAGRGFIAHLYEWAHAYDKQEEG